MVGSAIAADLARNFDVTVADMDPARIEKLRSQHLVHFRKHDLSLAKNVKAIVRGFDLVIGALPGPYGLLKL